jgi:hypothetical protein
MINMLLSMTDMLSLLNKEVWHSGWS